MKIVCGIEVKSKQTVELLIIFQKKVNFLAIDEQSQTILITQLLIRFSKMAKPSKL